MSAFNVISTKALRRISRIAKATGLTPVVLSGFKGFDPEGKSAAQKELEGGTLVVEVRYSVPPHYTHPVWGYVGFKGKDTIPNDETRELRQQLLSYL